MDVKEVHSNVNWATVKFRALYQSTVQVWKLLVKSNSTWASNLSFINFLKMVGCATIRDVLLLATLWYFIFTTMTPFSCIRITYWLYFFNNILNCFSLGIFSYLNNISISNYFKQQAAMSNKVDLASMNLAFIPNKNTWFQWTFWLLQLYWANSGCTKLGCLWMMMGPVSMIGRLISKLWGWALGSANKDLRHF